MKEWLIANWQVLLVLITAVVLFGRYVFLRWKNNTLDGLLKELLDYIKFKAGDELTNITRGQIDAFAMIIYVNTIQRTFLGTFVTPQQWKDVAWLGFVKYRDWYRSMDYHAAHILVPIPG